MSADEPQSLWAFGDPEPWRQGRAAILWISLLVVLVQSGLILWSFFSGDVREVILRALAGCFACLLLFLTWIGQNWVRWLVAPFFAFYGLRSVVWGIVYQRGGLLMIGIGTLIVFAYLAFSPSVYAFARPAARTRRTPRNSRGRRRVPACHGQPRDRARGFPFL